MAPAAVRVILPTTGLAGNVRYGSNSGFRYANVQCMTGLPVSTPPARGVQSIQIESPGSLRRCVRAEMLAAMSKRIELLPRFTRSMVPLAGKPSFASRDSVTAMRGPEVG